MDTLPADLETSLLKAVLGLVIALLGAILYNLNERLTYVERNAITPENLKEALKDAITETGRKHR